MRCEQLSCERTFDHKMFFPHLYFNDLYPVGSHICMLRVAICAWGRRLLSGSSIKDLSKWVLLCVEAITFIVLFPIVYERVFQLGVCPSTCGALKGETLRDWIWPYWVILFSHCVTGKTSLIFVVFSLFSCFVAVFSFMSSFSTDREPELTFLWINPLFYDPKLI